MNYQDAEWAYIVATEHGEAAQDRQFYYGMKFGMRLILAILASVSKERLGWLLLIETSPIYPTLTDEMLALLDRVKKGVSID